MEQWAEITGVTAIALLVIREAFALLKQKQKKTTTPPPAPSPPMDVAALQCAINRLAENGDRYAKKTDVETLLTTVNSQGRQLDEIQTQIDIQGEAIRQIGDEVGEISRRFRNGH